MNSLQSSWYVKLATAADLPAILTVFDAATVWLVTHNLGEQWGSTPPSQLPDFVERLQCWITDQLAGVAVDEAGQVQGCIVVGYHVPSYLPAAVGPTLLEDAGYIYTLATRREPGSRGAGAALLRWAGARAGAQGKHFLRLDCWADNNALLAYYRAQGFVVCGGYQNEEWPGALLEKRL